MADTDVGKKAEYNADGEWVTCWVVEYDAGRDQGDHLVAGFSTSKMKHSSGDTFSRWSVVGTTPGSFRLK